MSRRTASAPATHALTKMAATTNRPAPRSARSERSRNAMPSGIAVSASPKLWMRSASSATEPEAAKTAVCASAAIPRTPSEAATARTPSRERLIESSTRPWECPCAWAAGTRSGGRADEQAMLDRHPLLEQAADRTGVRDVLEARDDRVVEPGRQARRDGCPRRFGIAVELHVDGDVVEREALAVGVHAQRHHDAAGE